MSSFNAGDKVRVNGASKVWEVEYVTKLLYYGTYVDVRDLESGYYNSFPIEVVELAYDYDFQEVEEEVGFN